MSCARHVILLLVMGSCADNTPSPEECGNGVFEPDNGEECDEGAANSPEGTCTPSCKLPICGDGMVQAGESCDLGEANDPAAACTPNCEIARCGDGYVREGVEACDDGDALNKPAYDGLGGCTIACAVLPVCGDGIIGAPHESCDDGNIADGDGCDHLCQKMSCGDGVVDPGEECDDGNDVEGDACLGTCLSATCGDGILRPGEEECDDGNLIPDDGCNNACVRDRLVFLTEALFGPKSIGNLDGADLECRKVAQANNLPNPTAFKAWLSNERQSPSTRFYRSSGRYVLATGAVVADDWDDLTDGILQHAIDRTLDGKLITDHPTWTSTRASGEGWGDGNHCQNWTSSDIDSFGRGGVSGYADVFWTDIKVDVSCGNGAALYCFEQF